MGKTWGLGTAGQPSSHPGACLWSWCDLGAEGRAALPLSLLALAAAGGWSHHLGLAGLAEVGAGGEGGRGTSDFGMLIFHIPFVV